MEAATAKKTMSEEPTLYYCGIDNLNYTAVKSTFSKVYRVVLVRNKEEASALNVKAQECVVAIIMDIDTIDREICHQLIDFFCKVFKRPPFIALTNNAVMNLTDYSKITDLVKIVNVTQIRNEFTVLKHKVDWYHYHYFEVPSQHSISEAKRAEIISEQLKGALQEDKIFLVYHPMVNIKTDAFDTFEVLLKWDDAPFSDVDEYEIIDAAEKTGLLDPLSTWMAEKICGFQEYLKKHNGHFYNFNIDLSINQIMSDTFFESLKKSIETHNVPAECFSFELSSEILCKPKAEIEKIAEKIKDLGIKISINYLDEHEVCLSTVSALPVSFLKVKTLHLSDESEAMSKMAHEMGIKLIVKNVETDDNQDLFLNNQVDYAQDFCFHEHFEDDAVFKKVLRKDLD